MHFLRALVRIETQTSSSRIYTRVTDSISYSDNRYASALFKLSVGYKTIQMRAIYK